MASRTDHGARFGARINPGTANGTEQRNAWIGGAAALSVAVIIVGLIAGRGERQDSAAAPPSGSHGEEDSSPARTASLQPAGPQGSAQAAPAGAVILSPLEKAQKVRTLLEEAREALSEEAFDRAEQRLGEALLLDPRSKPAASLKRDLEEERGQERREAIRNRIAEFHEKGLRSLSESDVEGALRVFQAAQDLDPSYSRTFRLIEHTHRVRQHQEARQRRLAFREGASSSRAVSAPFVGIGHSVPHQQERPGEAAVLASARPTEYVIQPEDVLQITVFEEQELTTKARISRDGEITFPLLGQVQVAGLTVAKAQEKLTQRLGEDYLVHPQVQVFVEKPRNVFVTGEVHRPGSYPVSVERETTIMEIISMAGGFTEDADLNGTRIIRLENGQKRTLRARVGDIVRKGDKSQDVGVVPDDIVFVPESFF